VRTRIIKIGNSQGVRIPKLLIAQARLGEEVELEVQEGGIIVLPDKRPRHGWEEQFVAMAERGDDRLLDEELFGLEADEDDWQW
jgi:antitoxin MazE